MISGELQSSLSDASTLVEPERLSPMVKAVHLQKDVMLSEGTALRILNDLSFEVAASEFIALVGQSGCGKTTLLRVLLGIVPVTSGVIEVAGRQVRGCAHNRAMVFQNAELLPWRSALRNVEMGLETKGVPAKQRHAIAEHYLNLVGLSCAADRRPDQLSGGMRQRVGLARALAVDPDLLLMDEPFGAVDAHTREALQAELIRLHEQMRKTVVFVTHDLDEAVLLADRIFVLSPAGRLAAIIKIPIARPRSDPELIRSSPDFGELRYRVWATMRQIQNETRSSMGALYER
jgi:NitT/TauT family transport system ATP-binding protein